MKLIKILVAAFCILMAVTGIGVAFAAIDDTSVFLVSWGMVALFAFIAFALIRSMIKHKRKTNLDPAQITNAPRARVVQRDEGNINIAIPAHDDSQSVEIPFASIGFRHIDPDENVPTPSGAELSYLDAKALNFWNKKHTDYDIPSYYSDTAFGRNVGPALARLLDGGYLDIGGIDKSIGLKTVPELKAILADRELKVSGKKPELIQRLIDNVPPDELEAIFPVGVYEITPKGEAALGPYTIIEANDHHGLGLSYYRLTQERAEHPEDEDNVILTRLLSQDIQRCYEAGDVSNYVIIINKTGRFMHEIGEERLSLECYILAFFMWCMDARNLGIPKDSPQNYYQAKAIDESGKLCGYSLQELREVIYNTVKSNNPFNLGTEQNIRYALSLFNTALGI